MDKCPQCWQWTLALNRFRGVLKCRNAGCGYERKVDVKAWEKQHCVLSKLVGRR